MENLWEDVGKLLQPVENLSKAVENLWKTCGEVVVYCGEVAENRWLKSNNPLKTGQMWVVEN